MTDRLLDVIDQARSLRDPDAIARLSVEIDKLALGTARTTVADCRAEAAAMPVS